jgi:glutamate synthase domain-containing protein 2
MVNIAREAMLAVGCLQAQKCHTGHCPTGVATQNRWLTRGLDPTDKGARVANYIDALRYDLLRLAHAAGVDHPSLLPRSELDIIGPDGTAISLVEHYGLSTETQRHAASDVAALTARAT